MSDHTCKKCGTEEKPEERYGKHMLLKNYGYICYNCYCPAEQTEECKACHRDFIVVKIDGKIIEYRGKDGICDDCLRTYRTVKNCKK